MNDEKALLIDHCLTNPVIRLVIAKIVNLKHGQQEFRLPLSELDRLGLSEGAIKKTVQWLLRKGFLSTLTEGPYSQRGARYQLDAELREAFEGILVQPFGATGKKILDPFDSDKHRAPLDIISIGNSGWVGDEYGIPLSLNEARALRDALNKYTMIAEEMGSDALELHRKSRERLLIWGGRFGNVTGLDARPPQLLCRCAECTADYQALLSAWTNFSAIQKQENKAIRTAVAQLA